VVPINVESLPQQKYVVEGPNVPCHPKKKELRVLGREADEGL